MSVEDLVRTHVGLAIHIADRAVESRERPDARSDAMLGLWEAAEAFDPKHGAAFKTFALHRIHGAIKDGRRSRNGRRGQKQARLVEELPKEELPALIAPDCAASASEYVDLVRAIERLPAVVRAIVLVYYWGEWDLLEIARCLEVSESRVSQILTGARAHLRAELEVSA